MCVGVLSASMSVRCICIKQCPQRPEEGATDRCEPQRGCCEPRSFGNVVSAPNH